MEPMREKIEHAIENTEVLRSPQQSLITFGSTTIHYYLITEPVYAELWHGGDETVLREGGVLVERPQIVTPVYLANLFQGFEHGREFAEFLLHTYGPHEPGLLYRYKNELDKLDIIAQPIAEVADKLIEKLEGEREPLAAVIRGVDEMWDISLMKFIHDFTTSSLRSNVAELQGRGYLDIDGSHIPRGVRVRIEELFNQVLKGQHHPQVLKSELDRWGVFPEYEDRFLSLFGRR